MSLIRAVSRVVPAVVVDGVGCVEEALLTSDVGGFENTTLRTSASPYWWGHFGVVDHWAISTSDPRSGSDHLTGTGSSTSSLRLLGLVSGDQAAPNANQYYTHVASEGQEWTWRGYYKGPGGPAAGIVFDNSGRPAGTGTALDSATVSLTSSASYTEFVVELTAPADTAYVRVNLFRLSGASSSDEYDDWQLIVCD